MNTTTWKNRALSVMLTVIMVFSMLPLSVFATEDGNVAEVTIGGTAKNYTDIDEAFAAAQEADSATVKLLADVTVSHADNSGIALEKGNITLDLNGKTLSKSTRDDNGFYSKNAVFWLSPPGVTTKDDFLAALRMPVCLTVQDSVGGGKIVQPNGGPAVIATLNTILTVNGGTIENTSSDDFDDGRSHMAPNCAVLLSGGGKAVINGGTLSGMRGVAVTGYITKEEEDLYKEYLGIEGYNNDTYGNELTVTGGDICSTDGEALIVYEKAKKIELSGGTFTTQSNDYSIWVDDTEEDGEPTIKGDASSLLVNGYRYEYNGTECAYSEDGKGVKGNATVALRPANEYAYIDKDGKLTTQSGCTEITAATTELTAGGWYVVKEDVTISGNLSVNADNSVSLILCDGATLTVPGSVRLENGWALNIYGQTEHTGTLKVGSGTLEDSAVKAFGQHGGTIYFYGGTVTMQAKAGVKTVADNVYYDLSAGMKTVWTDSPNEWCTISNREGKSVTVTKCKDHVWEYTDRGDLGHETICDLCMTTDYSITPHSYTGWTDNGNGTHTGKCVCGAESTENHTLTCTPNADGLTHSGKCSKCVYEAGTENHDFNQTDEYGKKCACGAYLTASYNGQNYTSLASAVAAAAKNDGTVKLEMDVVESITVTDGMNVTVDLNGKTWFTTHDGGNKAALTVDGGRVTVKNGTMQTGGMASACTPVVINGGSLTVGESVTVLGTEWDNNRYCHAIGINGGELTLSVGTVLYCGMKAAEGKQLKDYLPADTAFTDDSGVIDGYVQEKIGKFTLTVVKHETHKVGENNKCDCGFVCEHKDGNDREASYFRKAVCATCHNEYGEVVTDNTAPTGSITIKERTPFQTFINKITFGLFFKEDVTATVTATDDSYTQAGFVESENAVKIEYLVSDEAFTEEDLKVQTFAEYTEAIDLTNEQNYVVYACLTDHAGNVTYLSTDGFVIDKTAPSINDFADGQEVHICGTSYTVSIKDANLDTVTLDGKEQSGDTIQFRYNYNGVEEHTVVATDKAGNTSTVTFFQHQAHDFDSETCVCKNYCGTTAAAKVQIGDEEANLYGTFDEAWDSILRVTEPVKLTLLADADITAGYVSLGNFDLTVDLNGYTFGHAGQEFLLKEGNNAGTSKLTVTGAGRFLSSILVGTNGRLTVEADVDHIKGVKISFSGEDSPTNWSVALKGGKYGVLDLNNDDYTQAAGKLGNLLAPGYVFEDSATANSTNAIGAKVVPCPNHTWHNGVCDNCNLPCPHELIINGECSTCHMTIVAMDDANNYYSDLNAAFAGVADGGKVTLLKDVNRDSTFEADKSVTLNMAGYKLMLDHYGTALTVKSGHLTVMDSGTEKTIRIGCTGTSIKVSGGTLKLENKVYLTGQFYLTADVAWDENYNPIFHSIGKLEGSLQEGSIFIGGIYIDYAGGDGYETAMELLSDGYAYASYDKDSGTTGDILRVDTSYSLGDENPIVVKHAKHGPFTYGTDSSDHKGYFCACGYEHTEHTCNEYGHCTLCSYVCPHTNATETDGEWRCDECGAQIVASLDDYYTIKYYAKSFDATGVENTLQTILNSAESGVIVTLLVDGLNAGVTVKNFTRLNLNDKTLNTDTEPSFTVNGIGLSIVGKTTSTLSYVVEKGALGLYQEGGKISYVLLNSADDDNLHTGENAVKIDRLILGSADVRLYLQYGEFGEIALADGVTDPVKVSSLLAPKTGRTFQHTDNSSYVLRATEITGTNSLKNVKVVVCPHEELDEQNCCLHCDTNYIVAIYSDGSVINPDTAENMASHAKEYAIRNLARIIEGGTVKLLVDYVSKDEEFSYDGTAGKGTFDLNGHKVSGGTLTLPDGAELTVTDTSEGKTGKFANVTVESGATLIVDGTKISGVTLKEGGKIEIKNGGVLESVTTESGNLIDFLPTGYAFANLDGDIVGGYVKTLNNVQVVPHTKHTGAFWDTTSHKLLCACGKTVAQDTVMPKFEGIKHGSTYYGDVKFKVTHKYDFTVTDNGTVITPDEEGYYTIKADNNGHEIRATAVSGNNNFEWIKVYKLYNVTLPSGTGYTVSGESTAKHGQDYTFKVTIAEGYSRVKGSYKVLVNGTEIPADLGDETLDRFTVTAIGDLTITVEGIADITAPDAEMTIGTNRFKEFLNTVTFGLFFKETQEVNITASDKGSGVKAVEYLLSDSVFDKISDITGKWTEVEFENGEATFNIEPKLKKFIYVRVTDKDGNTAVINSDGVVLYEDSTADTENITFTRLSDEDVSFKVNLNGNWFDRLLISDGKTTSSINGIISSDGTVTLKNEDLRKLAAGEYTITVVYNPMGESYAENNGNEAPASTTVKLTVEKATRELKFSAPDAIYDGAEYDDLRITDKPGCTVVEYKVKDADDSTYGTAAPQNVGNYTVKISVDADENYNAATFTKDFAISPKEVTIKDVVVKAVKEYDGSAAAKDMNIVAAYIDGKCEGDDLTIDATGAEANFTDKNVGTAKTVTFSGFKLGGSAAGNYKLIAQPASVTADITVKELTVEGLKIKDKTYDGTNKAEFDGTPTLGGVCDGDDVQLVCGTPTFTKIESDLNNPIEINFTEFTLDGADSGNYTLAQPTGITAKINAWDADGSEFTTTTQKWSNTDFVVTAKDGYSISLSNTADGEWVKSLTASETTTGDFKYITFYVKDETNGAISEEITLGYLIDKTAPTGTITLNDGTPFREFVTDASFDMLYNDDVTVKLTANDEASGIQSAEYYKSNNMLGLDEVKKLTDWTEGDSFVIKAEDAKQFIIYARITDNAGNVTYISSDGAEFDTASPVIDGVENGKTYYVNQKITIDDKNLKSVTLNGNTTALPFTLEGDKEAVYTIVATDKAGNKTEYTVNMLPISDITDAIKDITEDNVKSDNAETIADVAKQIEAVADKSDMDVIGEEQQSKLTAASEKCGKLRERITAVAEEIVRHTDAVNAYDIDKITSANKADIERLIADIDSLINGDNLIDAERETLEALKETATLLTNRIDDAKAAAESDEITTVKDITKDNVTLDDKDALEKAEKALEDALKDFEGNYTDDERKSLTDSLDTVKNALAAIGNAEKTAEEVKNLPSVDDVKLTDKDEVERIKTIFETLTENEKSMLGEEAVGKIKALIERIDTLTAEAEKSTSSKKDDTSSSKTDKSTSPKTGDSSSLAMWFTLLFISGGVAVRTTIARRKRFYHN